MLRGVIEVPERGYQQSRAAARSPRHGAPGPNRRTRQVPTIPPTQSPPEPLQTPTNKAPTSARTTAHQLGLFALRPIPPGTPLLTESSLLTATLTPRTPHCDACSLPLPSLSPSHT